MPTASVSIVCPAGVGEVSAQLQDLDFLSGTVPDVISIQRLSATSAEWTVRTKVGLLTRTMVFRGDLLEATESRIRFHAEAKEATIDGTINLSSEGSQTTRVHLNLQAAGKGALGPIIDNLLRSRIGREAEKFGTRLQERFSSPGSG
jgi:carbon monoxide dehydrogenase subunit G